MDIRYSTNPRDVKRYTTEELREEFHISGLYEADQVKAVYSHVDRMVTLGVMPVSETVSIDKGIDVWANFGTHYFLERRELGMFNLGGSGVVVCDGREYPMGYKDCLYVTMGTKEVLFRSSDPANPARFYIVSAPAHRAYETRLITLQTAPLRERQPDGSRHPFDSFIVAKTPAARWGTPEDLMGPAVFLASDASNFVNGHILYVDGGILAYIGKQP